VGVVAAVVEDLLRRPSDVGFGLDDRQAAALGVITDVSKAIPPSTLQRLRQWIAALSPAAGRIVSR
jgi:hypothetical protein